MKSQLVFLKQSLGETIASMGVTIASKDETIAVIIASRKSELARADGQIASVNTQLLAAQGKTNPR